MIFAAEEHMLYKTCKLKPMTSKMIQMTRKQSTLVQYPRPHGVMVSTLDFESSDPSSILGEASGSCHWFDNTFGF